jgi:hypothetical protein
MEKQPNDVSQSPFNNETIKHNVGGGGPKNNQIRM